MGGLVGNTNVASDQYSLEPSLHSKFGKHLNQDSENSI